MAPKSQAAMEFMLTYGWAIVVVVTVIAALAYFGLLDTSRYTPHTCTLPPGLSCLDHTVTINAAGTRNRLQTNIKNNLGSTIRLNTISSQYGASAGLGNVEIQPGEQSDSGTISLPDATRRSATGIIYPAGSKYTFEFTLTVENIDTGLTHQFTGNVQGTAIR